MKLHALLALVLGLLGAVAAAWSKEDHEIFRLRDEVVLHDGSNLTFYDLIGVSPSASQDQINKAYRKKSRQIHPDKARQSFIAGYALNTPKPKPGEKKKPGVHVRKSPSKKEVDAHMKEATSRYQRLTVVVEILKGPSRERYDHFLRNGFPKWRGTGYYYARFRPGLGSVLLGLLVVGGGAVHYGAMYLNWKRQRDFIERYIRHARKTAWGDDSGIVGIPGGNGTPASQGWETPTSDEPSDNMPMNRRQKRMQEKESRKGKNVKAVKAARTSGISTPVEASLTSGPVGAKKRIVAENGKVLIVDSVGNVYVEGESGEGVVEEYLLDVDEIPRPTIYDTLLFRLPKFVYSQSVGRILGTKPDIETLLESEDEDQEAAALTSATAPNANAEARKRKIKRAK